MRTQNGDMKMLSEQQVFDKKDRLLRIDYSSLSHYVLVLGIHTSPSSQRQSI